MSPGQVERLKGNRANAAARPRPSAVATRVPRDEGWPQDEDSDDEDDNMMGEPRRKGAKIKLALNILPSRVAREAATLSRRID